MELYYPEALNFGERGVFPPAPNRKLPISFAKVDVTAGTAAAAAEDAFLTLTTAFDTLSYPFLLGDHPATLQTTILRHYYIIEDTGAWSTGSVPSRYPIPLAYDAETSRMIEVAKAVDPLLRWELGQRGTAKKSLPWG